MGNGSGLKISVIGYAHLRSSISINTLVLKDLLHVPEITKNLISISKFCRDNNIFFEFHSNTCYVVHQVTKRVLHHNILKNGLYIFPTSQSVSQYSVNSLSFIADKINVNTWHEYFGHCSFNVLKQIPSQCNIHVYDNIQFCSTSFSSHKYFKNL